MSGDAKDGGWDDIIVGAGSAGAVLASRLSERSDRRVLLIEAGADSPDLIRPDGPVLNGYNWDYDAQANAGLGRRLPYLVGKVVGGSSAINGAIALRGLECDFAQWAAAGNPDWAWDGLLSYFREIETDVDYGGAVHGTAGPIPIRRCRADELDAVESAFWRACTQLGLPDVPDLNAGSDIGVGPVPMNSDDGRRRLSVVDTHLTGARRRPNLTVWDRSWVRRVLFTGRRASGVELVRQGREVQVAAARVTLSAGAINTPCILLRSGLGKAHCLATAGIRQLVHLPGVGENLIDHPTIAIWSLLRPGVRLRDHQAHSVMARLSVGGGDPDVSMTVTNNVAVPDMPGVAPIVGGRPCVSVAAALLHPTSRGVVALRDGDPDGPPVITLRLASTPADVDLLMRATRFTWSLLHTSPLAELIERTFVWTERMISQSGLLEAAVPRFVSPLWHAAGTARMGSATDEMAVVDQRLRVHGVDGLRVVDASVMPSIPRGTPNLTCIVIAERAAAWMDAAETG